jgi:DnaJ homolog subfamily A member 5
MSSSQTDYYELLGIERDADDEIIKKAYRKKALEWHPDKNLHRAEEATEKFREIQNAYSVLSDPVERRWYDEHKDDILKPNSNDEEGAVLINLFSYFRSNVFSAFDDSERGFYTVYSSLFLNIAKEELKFASSNESEGKKKSLASFPNFGTSKTPEADVLSFYEFWMHYSTGMHFGWTDEYNPMEAPNRFVRRQIEAENKKCRAQHRKKRSEEIHALVEYVKKRDARYIEITARMKQKQLEEKAKHEEALAKKKSASQSQGPATSSLEAIEANRTESEGAFRLADLHSMLEEGKRKSKIKVGKDLTVVRAPISPEVVEKAVAAEDGGEDNEDEEDDVNFIFCEPCSKSFRSDAAFANHEKSKKHLQALAKWKAIMADLGEEEEEEEVEIEEQEEAIQVEVKNTQEQEKDVEEDNQIVKEDDVGGTTAASVSSSTSSESDSNSDSEDDILMMAAALRKSKLQSQKIFHKSVDSDEGDEEESKLEKSSAKSSSPAPPTSASTEATNPPAPLKGGKKAKAKRANNASSGSKGQESVTTKVLSISSSSGLKCASCGEIFDSRNQLFAHIKKTGHAAPKGVDEILDKRKR